MVYKTNNRLSRQTWTKHIKIKENVHKEKTNKKQKIFHEQKERGQCPRLQ
ncbi:MAG: hypothetical protein [Wigfec virus K19_83]|nr:MAG: hypothetical protein [Wigfec virus K19_83]